jgi:hypothetical protein
MHMKSVLGFLLAFSVPLMAGPENASVTFWVQLVNANQAASVQPANWKPIGPELNKRLADVFRWREYYEVARQEVQVEPGKIAKAKLASEREVAISFKSPTELEVRLYRDGQLIRKAQRNLHQKLTIMGGDGNEREAWFVVVRRDKPGKN